MTTYYFVNVQTDELRYFIPRETYAAAFLEWRNIERLKDSGLPLVIHLGSFNIRSSWVLEVDAADKEFAVRMFLRGEGFTVLPM